MIIKNLLGKTICKTSHRTMRAAIENCVARKMDLSLADFRNEKLCGASLDGIAAKGACFWGADLRGADIGFGDLRCTDMRCTDLKDTCLAQSDMTGSDMRGAYFSGTIFEESVLDRVIVSCPSFWECDLRAAASFKELIFTHLGEHDMPVETVPLVIRGLDRRLVLNGETCLWGDGLYPAGLLPRTLEQELFALKMNIERLMKRSSSHNASKHIPKIANDQGRT